MGAAPHTTVARVRGGGVTGVPGRPAVLSRQAGWVPGLAGRVSRLPAAPGATSITGDGTKRCRLLLACGRGISCAPPGRLPDSSGGGGAQGAVETLIMRPCRRQEESLPCLPRGGTL